jgi:hypothetical protein
MEPIPELNKEYHIFDDGKIKPSRHYTCIITDIITFGECEDSALLDAWEREVRECPWLYEKETDYFIKATSDFDEYPLYFVRTIDGGWFSIDYPNCWMGVRLDTDGKLYSWLLELHGGKVNDYR